MAVFLQKKSFAALGIVCVAALTACGDGSSSASNNEQSASPESVSSCPAEMEGVYKTVEDDTVAVYPDGGVRTETQYYRCESGAWVKSECRDPSYACTEEKEGTVETVVCPTVAGNPKIGSEAWSFVCKNNKWEEISNVEASCSKPDTKIGDVCSTDSKGAMVIGGPATLNCYVYTEEGWLKKGADNWYEEGEFSCEDVLNAPKVEKECSAESDYVEETVDDVTYYYQCASGEWQVCDISRPGSAISDEERYCIPHTPTNLLCADTMNTDGMNVQIGLCYFKCESNAWEWMAGAPSNDTLYDYYSVYDLAYWKLPKCTPEKEGEVRNVWHGNTKYGTNQNFRCENGEWVPRDLWVTCDTAGVQVGDSCARHTVPNLSCQGFSGCHSREFVYIYKGEGEWEDLDSYVSNIKKCSAENKGSVEKFVVGTAPITAYYICTADGWSEASELDYRCTTANTVVGDTCSFESGDSTLHYIYAYVDYYKLREYHKNIWVEATVDSVLGYCPEAKTELYIRKDEDFYYCNYANWKKVILVPHQYTDPRKEGLTDEEFDVLDLPKEASVGDRVGGLLENCTNYGKFRFVNESNEEHYEAYAYCLSQNYYRYREDGSWTLETRDDLGNDPFTHEPKCSEEVDGAEYGYLPNSSRPGTVYKRVYLCDNANGCHCRDLEVDHIFGRSQKVDL